MWVDRVLSPTPFLWGKGGAGILKVEELRAERRWTNGEGRDLREEEVGESLIPGKEETRKHQREDSRRAG